MPSTKLRQTVLTSARRIIVKLGTQLLTNRDPAKPGLDRRYIASIAKQIAELRQKGYEVTLVSSGAVGAGCAELGLAQRPTDVAAQQAVAAVGQRRLMDHMHNAFARHGIGVGQMLLTRGDFDDRTRFLNIRNCVTQLHALGCIPIVNENDTVAVDEIRFGDNDLLAALLCNCVRAEAVILLTVVDGLLDENKQRVDLVEDVEQRLDLAKVGKSQWGSGGMSSKLQAARIVTEAGEIAVIANGREKNVILRLLAGEKLGTVVLPAQRKLDSRKRWIGLTLRPGGSVTIDDGAASALCSRGKSLLASGIINVEGHFERGAAILICDSDGQELARGLSNYSDDELRQIQGKRSNQFAKILGRPAFAEVVHRDNLVLLESCKAMRQK